MIELLVVVVIIAIAAAMVIPYAINTDDLEVASAARMISTDLQYAQNTAITSQTPITVSFNTVGESYTLSNASGLLIHPMSKSDFVIDFSAQRGFESLDIVSASFAGAATVTFDELGSPDNSGTITLQAGAFVYVVNVAVATGKVTVAASGP